MISRNLSNPRLLCVFVMLKETGADDFYVFQLQDLQDLIFEEYKSRVRPRNPHSKHFAIWPEQIKKFAGNWALVEEVLTASS